jgi:hypothetical protein
MDDQISGMLALVFLWAAAVKTDAAEGIRAGRALPAPQAVTKGLLPAASRPRPCLPEPNPVIHHFKNI